MYQVTQSTSRIHDRNLGKFIDKQVLILVDENGNRDSSRWQFEATEQDKAQAMCDELNSQETAVDTDFFAGMFEAETGALKDTETTTPQEQPVQAQEIIVEGQNEVGSTIEYKGEQWLVTNCEYEDEPEPAVTHDEYDEHLPIGWHSWLKKV